MVNDSKIEHIDIEDESLHVRNSEKDKIVSEVINALAEKPLNFQIDDNDNDSDTQCLLHILNLLESLYMPNSDEELDFRHSYSNIYNTMVRLISLNEGKLFNSRNNKLENLSNNIQWIKDILDKENKISSEKALKNKAIVTKIHKLQNDIKFNKGFFKLYDHVLLEYARLASSTSWIARVEIAEGQLKLTNAGLENLREESNELKKKSQNMQKDYVTILGIFSSIVITFVAGMVFSSSVLNNIDKASIYRLTFVMISIGFFIFNLLNLLLHTLQRINRWSGILITKGKYSFITKINVTLLLCLFIDILLWWTYWHRALYPDLWMRLEDIINSLFNG